jgi:hypothetical protein
MIMEEAYQNSNQNLEQAEGAAPTQTSGADGQPSLAMRREQRQRELLETVLTQSDPKAAVVGAALAELMEFAPILKNAMTEVVSATGDPAQRLATLSAPLAMYANICKLAGKLP